MAKREKLPPTVGEMNEGDRTRVEQLLRQIGGQHVVWGAQSVLDVWVAETRMREDKAAARRVEIATWALVVVTLVLALATVGLIVATLQLE